jgi:hypothetical protein
MILKKMTDFVFMLRNRTTSELCSDFPNVFKLPVWKGSQSEMVKDMLAIDAIQWRLTGEFAKFLIQKAELWMFVPCKKVDGIWIPLEKPAPNNLNESFFKMQQLFHQEKEYDEAITRVLFEGFTYHKGLDKNNPDFWFVRNSTCKIHDYQFEVQKLPLENLANMNYILQLTPTAQKLIGLLQR